jgi:serine protease Do
MHERLAIMGLEFQMNRRLVLAVVVVAALVAARSTPTVGADGDTRVANYSQSSTTAEPAGDASLAKQLSSTFRAAAKRVLPAVVAIESRSRANDGGEAAESEPFRGDNPFQGTPFEDFFKDRSLGPQLRMRPPDGHREIVGIGSGFIIDPKGIILTNNHVVEGDGTVTVRLNDERVFKATEVKTDPKSDLAIVRIEGANDLVAAKLGDSDQMEVGDWVLALGQPFGLESTVTAGIISATHRDIGISAREHYFQTDAAINPGNSGGPLVNLSGEVIGINTAISTQSGGNEGIGFAVPSNLAHWISSQLIENGSVRRAYLGVGIQSMTPQLAQEFGVKPHQGALISRVYPSTPAAKMGLESGDVVTAVDGKAVQSAQDLQFLVEEIGMDRTHEMTVVRQGKPLTLTFQPEAEPEDFGATTAQRREAEPERGSSEDVSALGIHIGDLTPELAQRIGVAKDSGAVITDIDADSLARQAGLRPGLVIAEVNRQAIHSAADAKSVLDKASLQDGVLLLLQSDEGSMYVVLKQQ